MNQPASIVPYWHGAPLSSFASEQILLALSSVGVVSYGFGAIAKLLAVCSGVCHTVLEKHLYGRKVSPGRAGGSLGSHSKSQKPFPWSDKAGGWQEERKGGMFLLVKLILYLISTVYCIFSFQYLLTNYILIVLLLF